MPSIPEVTIVVIQVGLIVYCLVFINVKNDKK